MNAKTTLALENLRQRYPKKGWALDGVDLHLQPGITGVLGPNGAGKSSLLRIIATLQRPTGGRVLFRGHDVVKEPERLRPVLGYLPQHFGSFPHLSALELLTYLAAVKGMRGAAARRRIEELLCAVNLEDAARRPVGGYSGGMRQRLGIAQALLNDPALLILDEPTVGLDPEERIRFRNLLADLGGERIILLASHIVSDIEATADNIAVLLAGRILAHEDVSALLRRVHGRVFEWVVEAAEVESVRSRHQVTQAVRRADGVQLRMIAHESPHPRARPVEPNLEDAYVAILNETSKSRAA